MSISLEKSGRDNFQFVPLEEDSASPPVCLERDSDEELKTKARPAVNSSSTYTIEDAVEAAGLGCFQLRLFLICGILTAADAMEMLLLSILGPALRCAWHLTSNEVAAMTTVVFVGYLLGSPFWGFVSDRFGRWPIFFTVLSMIAYYGFLTALSPTYVWVIILRLMVGFAIGGGSSSFTLLSEYLPVKHRAKVLICFQVFWAIGSTFEVGLAYLILPRFGWRWLVFASAVPLVLFLFLLKFLPESPRYLVTANRLSEAEHIVQNMFRVNGVRPPEGRLTTSTVTSKRCSRLLELFSKQYRLTTVLLPTIWFGAAFAYYGVVLLSAEIFRFRQDCYRTSSLHPVSSDKNLTAASIQASIVHQVVPHQDVSCCQELTDSDFVTMIVSSVGEFVNIPIIVILIDLLGRKITMGIWNGITGLMFFILYICMSRQAMTGVLFGVRAMAAALLSLAYVYTGEVFPTTVRALAIGIFSSVSRLGAMTTPYVAQVMLPEYSEIGALSLYAAISLLCAVLSFVLPIETAGRELPNTIEEPDSE